MLNKKVNNYQIKRIITMLIKIEYNFKYKSEILQQVNNYIKYLKQAINLKNKKMYNITNIETMVINWYSFLYDNNINNMSSWIYFDGALDRYLKLMHELQKINKDIKQVWD